MKLETLRIKNFASIKEADIELAQMNVFIGPQASGKSVCAKLFFFFKECLANLRHDSLSERTEKQIRESHVKLFLKYFPPSYWGKGPFALKYEKDGCWIEIKRKSGTASNIDISYDPSIERLLANIVRSRNAYIDMNRLIEKTETPFPETLKHKHGELVVRYDNIDQHFLRLFNRNFYIPAGRSFFAFFSSILFHIVEVGDTIDPFLVKFGASYEEARSSFASLPGEDAEKAISKYFAKLIFGTYERINSKDFIVMDDGRRVSIENCSSGQQEALPLVAMLWHIANMPSGTKSSTMIIEEPESHLFPVSQRDIVRLVTSALDLSSAESKSQCLVTTHSPYILSALNNLMYGGKIVRDFPNKSTQVASLLDESALIDPAAVRAYYISDGKAESIIDAESGLIEESQFDSISGEFSEEFEALIDIEFEKIAA